MADKCVDVAEVVVPPYDWGAPSITYRQTYYVHYKNKPFNMHSELEQRLVHVGFNESTRATRN